MLESNPQQRVNKIYVRDENMISNKFCPILQALELHPG